MFSQNPDFGGIGLGVNKLVLEAGIRITSVTPWKYWIKLSPTITRKLNNEPSMLVTPGKKTRKQTFKGVAPPPSLTGTRSLELSREIEGDVPGKNSGYGC